jgi:hypothetical protein
VCSCRWTVSQLSCAARVQCVMPFCNTALGIQHIGGKKVLWEDATASITACAATGMQRCCHAGQLHVPYLWVKQVELPSSKQRLKDVDATLSSIFPLSCQLSVLP